MTAAGHEPVSASCCRTHASLGCGGAPTVSCCAASIPQWVYADAPQTRGSHDLKHRLAALPKHRSHFSNDMRHREDLGLLGDVALAFQWSAEDPLFQQVMLLPRHFHFNAIRCTAPSNTATGPGMLYTDEGRSALYSNLSCFAAVRLPPRDHPSSATFRSCH
jgi:hypothetical protein